MPIIIACGEDVFGGRRKRFMKRKIGVKEKKIKSEGIRIN